MEHRFKNISPAPVVKIILLLYHYLCSNTHLKASVYLIIAAFLWGTNFYLLKIMLSSVHFMEIGFWRYLFAVVALVFYNGKSLPSWKTIKKNKKGVLFVGTFGLFSFNVFLFYGLVYTTPINASLILSLNPTATLFLTAIF